MTEQYCPECGGEVDEDGGHLDAKIRLDESANKMGGLRMSLYYGGDLVVNVTHVPDAFAATMRGALMLIGGMAKANELEEVGG